MRLTYFVYILASESCELYVGVTNDLSRRLAQHRSGLNQDTYTTKHRTFRLVYCESTDDVTAAIRREKQIKGWSFGSFASLRMTMLGFGPLAERAPSAA
jgi:putative endonuclease